MPKEDTHRTYLGKEERRCWPVHKQFRVLPCKFFGADKKFCANGDKCAFSHIYKGCDYHASARASDEATWDRKARALVSAGEASPTADSRSAERTRAAGLTREPVKRKRTRPANSPEPWRVHDGDLDEYIRGKSLSSDLLRVLGKIPQKERVKIYQNT